MSSDLRYLLDALCSVSIEVDAQEQSRELDWSRIPTAASLIVFEDRNGRAILIRAIGDPRAFIRRRLDPALNDEFPSTRTDFAAVTRRIRVLPTGIPSLAELLVPCAETVLDPPAAEATAARLSGCAVRCDPTARLPKFTTVALSSLWTGEHTISSHETLIGPFATPKLAQRWTETVIDLFDLCRYDHLLAQTPHATACVYKQMGKCPAPCDGSEPIESYRERFARASRFFGEHARAELARCTESMQAAADQLDFEGAAAIKQRADAIQVLRSGGPWEVGDLLDTRWTLSGCASKTNWVRTCSLDPTGLRILADRRSTPDESSEHEDRSIALVRGPIIWLMLDVLLDRLRKGLATGERLEVRPMSEHPQADVPS